MRRVKTWPLILICSCSSEQIIQGTAGEVGSNGQDCWDLNANGEEDTSEDRNGDGNVDILDCQGDAGADGQDCWDLNDNGEPDPEEDINGDGSVDVQDCQGSDDDDTGPFDGTDTGDSASELTAYFGDIAFTSAEAMHAFCTQHDRIWGNVYIYSDDFGLTDVDGLECLSYIDGLLYVHGPNLVRFELPNLTGVGDFTINSADALPSISLPAVTEIRGFVYLYSSQSMTQIDFSRVTAIEEDMTFQTTGLTDLDSLGNLRTVGGSISVDNNDSLTDISGVMGITYIGGDLRVSDNDNLSDADIQAWVDAIGEENIEGEVSIWGNGS